MVSDLADRIEGLAGPEDDGVADICLNLSEIEGCPATFDADGDFRFWKWGDEFYCVRPKQVAIALRARAK